MSLADRIRDRRDWIPVPDVSGNVNLVRWILLEGNRLAVTGAIITVVYTVLLVMGWYWTTEMQLILTETPTVGNILESFMSGIILLVSIVVSINSIVLSQDIATVQNQEARARGAREFRDDIGHLSETGDSPSDPRAFLKLMGPSSRIGRSGCSRFRRRPRPSWRTRSRPTARRSWSRSTT